MNSHYCLYCLCQAASCATLPTVDTQKGTRREAGRKADTGLDNHPRSLAWPDSHSQRIRLSALVSPRQRLRRRDNIRTPRPSPSASVQIPIPTHRTNPPGDASAGKGGRGGEAVSCVAIAKRDGPNRTSPCGPGMHSPFVPNSSAFLWMTTPDSRWMARLLPQSPDPTGATTLDLFLSVDRRASIDGAPGLHQTNRDSKRCNAAVIVKLTLHQTPLLPPPSLSYHSPLDQAPRPWQ